MARTIYRVTLDGDVYYGTSLRVVLQYAGAEMRDHFKAERYELTQTVKGEMTGEDTFKLERARRDRRPGNAG